jgi:methyl-accepting chemotaxis protein
VNAPAPDDTWWLDTFLADATRADSDELRRGRLFVVASLVLAAAALFFAFATAQSSGRFGAVSVTLLAGASIAIINLPLSKVLQRQRVMSAMVCAEHVFFVSACGALGAGATDPALWWLAPAPLVATILLGPVAGIMSAIACSLSMTGLYAAHGLAGVRFRAADADNDLFVTLGAVTVFCALAALAVAYERTRRNSMLLVDEAVARLQHANEELSRVATALTSARDQAVADGQRKNEFLDDMRRFSGTQTTALSQASSSTQRLTQTIRAITKSVDTLADVARGSSRGIDGVTDASTVVQETSATLVSAVGEVASALGALRGAASSVQNGIGALRSQAHETARSMSLMEGSAKTVREAATRTASLASAVSTDAERGATAVTRSADGVDQIRETAVHLRGAMHDLVQRVEAVDRILAVIDEVTVETNVLALNASIIAAQAGEHGRGFGIVAEQIKGLAARVAKSTRESASVIDDVKLRARSAGQALIDAVEAVNVGDTLTHHAGLALGQILRSATEATEMARGIEERTVEQAEQAAAVRAAMTRVLTEVETAARATTEQARAADRIAETVERLKALAPDLSMRSLEQSAGAKEVRQAIARVSAMAEELRNVQAEQTRASEIVFASVDELHRAQQGIDRALTALRR